MKLFTCGRNIAAQVPSIARHECCNIFLHKWIISLSHKQSHDNFIIFIYFMMKVLDNFHSPSMVVWHHGTMIWLEQKLFWVFGFKSFIMLIEMQNRVGFSKILWKNKKYIHFMLQFWHDSFRYWVNLYCRKMNFVL